MPVQTLTENFLLNLVRMPPEERQTTYFDTEVKGFSFRRRKTGFGTFSFQYREQKYLSKKINLVRIGSWPDISLNDARQKAAKMRKLVQDGGAPQAERKRKGIPTFEEFVMQQYAPYIKNHKRTWKNDIGVLKARVFPRIGSLPLNHIEPIDIAKLQNYLAEANYKPATINQTFNIVKAIFNCAIRWKFLQLGENPCCDVKPINDLNERERYLTKQELNRLFRVLDAHKNKLVSNIIRMLILTGARKREIADLRWSEVDLEKLTITIPPSRSKTKRVHVIPLSRAAVDLLQSLPRDPEIPWVFFNPRTKKSRNCFHWTWASIRRQAGLEDLRLHDLRHSYASFLVNSGRSLYEVQRLLGHQSPRMTMRYAHLAPSALLDATNVVGDLVRETMSGQC